MPMLSPQKKMMHLVETEVDSATVRDSLCRGLFLNPCIATRCTYDAGRAPELILLMWLSPLGRTHVPPVRPNAARRQTGFARLLKNLFIRGETVYRLSGGELMDGQRSDGVGTSRKKRPAAERRARRAAA